MSTLSSTPSKKFSRKGVPLKGKDREAAPSGGSSSLPSHGRRGAEQIAQFYTREILSGALAPGAQLPPSNEIAGQWSVGATVVQRAMRSLVAAGLVDRERKSGTVVRNHRERALIGVIVGPSLADETAHYYRALITALESLLNGQVLSLRVYDGAHPMSLKVTKLFHPLDLLKIDRIYYQFKGLILLQIGSPVPREITAWDIPKVTLSANPAQRSDLSTDENHMARTIVEEMRGRGARRLLIVSTTSEPHLPAYCRTYFNAQAALMEEMRLDYLTLPVIERGWHFEEQAFQTLKPLIADWKSGKVPRPDAIVVMDDIAARGVCMALLQAQIKVPDEMKVVVAATDSVVHHYGMPVYRYEHSVVEIAQRIKALLLNRISGEGKEPDFPPSQGILTESPTTQSAFPRLLTVS